MQDQIQVLLSQGLSIRKVALALGVSRQTIRRYQRPGASAADLLDPHSVDWDAAIDWQTVSSERAKGANVKQLHQEFAPEVTYGRFRRRLLAKLPPKVKPTLRLEHKPGEQAQVDYADGIPIIDRATGVSTKTHLFCGVLPFSSYTFGEFVLSQNLPSFIASHEHMWAFFGGVTPYVVIDNLKAGVHKAHRYDPDVNPTYCEYGNHQGFAVLPARPYKPRDKATVEATIGAIQRGFYQEVRNRSFYSIAELNETFRVYLVRFNAELMKDHGQSREQRFEAEKQLLRPLPAARFELSEWRSAKVHPDCHVQVDKCFYSVPHQTIGQTLRVRLTEALVEVFNNDGQSLAAHARLKSPGKFSTDDRHYPDEKLSIQRFEVRVALRDAERIGPQTLKLIESLLVTTHPLRHLRRVQGVLRLYQSGKFSRDSVEYASGQALNFRKPRLAYIRSCAEYFMAHGARPVLVKPSRSPDEVFLHASSSVVAGGPL
jgi:transposase